MVDLDWCYGCKLVPTASQMTTSDKFSLGSSGSRLEEVLFRAHTEQARSQITSHSYGRMLHMASSTPLVLSDASYDHQSCHLYRAQRFEWKRAETIVAGAGSRFGSCERLQASHRCCAIAYIVSNVLRQESQHSPTISSTALFYRHLTHAVQRRKLKPDLHNHRRRKLAGAMSSQEYMVRCLLNFQSLESLCKTSHAYAAQIRRLPPVKLPSLKLSICRAS